MYLWMAWAGDVTLHLNYFHGAKLGSGSSLTLQAGLSTAN